MRSFFSKRNGAQSRKRKQVDEVSADGTPNVFKKGDESLVQLHAETAELLRLVKPQPKSMKKSSKLSTGTTSTRGKTRLTIEVLDDEDDEEAESKPIEKDNPKTPPKAPIPVDPFAFDAEEARIRQGKDTFYPDMRPSKHGVEWQKNAFQREQNRLEEIHNNEQLRAEQTIRTKQRKREQTLENRLETSATLIQAHSRGFLCRRRQWQEKEEAAPVAVDKVVQPEAGQWHEVRDVERGEVWYYNATTGVSQWESPEGQTFTPAPMARSLPELPALNANSSFKTVPRTTNQRSSSGIGTESLPPLSSACSSARSTSSDQQEQHQQSSTRRSNDTNMLKKTVKSPRSLPALQPEYVTSSPNPWDCDSVLPSERSLSSEQTQDIGTTGDYTDSERGEELFGRRRSLPLEYEDRDDDDLAPLATEDANSDWQTNDTLFRADGTKNSKLRDTIRSALHVSKFDSISSLIASNVVLRRKSVPGRAPRNQGGPTTPGSRRREIVLGKREEPVFVAVLARNRDKRADRSKGEVITPESPAKSSGIRNKAKASSRSGRPPHIRDLADPGFLDDISRKKNSQQQENEDDDNDSDPDSKEAARREAARVCFNCWSASNGRHCELHQDPREATRKVRATECALMCANWELDQLRRKYRAEEIQEIFMKQRASLRYDRKLKQYVTVIECRHPIYRALNHLLTSWNKTMRRKLHTRAWFRSFLEQIRADLLPRTLVGRKDTNRPPSLFKLKNTLQNTRWVSKYSESVAEFHPKAPVTTKDRTGQHRVPLRDIIMINPAKPQLRNWILVTEYTKPVALYRPRVYELPPPRCVPMPVPSFLERLPLPVPNVHIDAGHSASWLERLSARMAIAALQKAALQIGACSPPHGSTDARRIKHVRPLVVLFATFSRKPTPGNRDIGGLSAELLIHMLVTTYIPAQFGNFVVFDRRAVAPSPSRDETALFACLIVDPTAPEFVFRALQHALNVRRPPCTVIAARIHAISQTDSIEKKHELLLLEERRFPLNRPEQTGEEDANGFRTFWLVNPFAVPDAVAGVQVAPSSAILAPNIASMNATITTRVDRSYPFCVPTTRENTPVEFIHLLWIGQSSRNQPQAFTTLGRQQPGDFMKNSDPDGALGLCSSVVYRSWAYMQDSPYDEFVSEDGVTYWYNRDTGDTFWTRPILPTEKHRGKDGDIDGVITTGEGEVATLGVGLGNSAGGGDADAAKDGGAARYSQQNLRKYMTKKMEAPEEKERRVKLVTTSAKKHDIIVDFTSDKESGPVSASKGELTRIQVPQLSLKRQPQQRGVGSRASSASSTKSCVQLAGVSTHEAVESHEEGVPSLDSNTKQMIDSITQALGSALPALSQANGVNKGAGVDMLQLGIGLGMGLGLRVQQATSPTRSAIGPGAPSMRSDFSRKPQQSHRSHSTHDFDEQDEEDEGEEEDPESSRSETSSVGTSLLSSRSGYSVAPSVDISPTPDDVKLNRGGPHVGKKTPGYVTHPAPGEGTSWVPRPVNASGESQTAVEGFGGALHQRVACLPKDFVAAVTSTKTCQMQANYLPIIKNMNQPRSVGIVRPRGALEEWLTVGYSPWTAGRAIFGTQFIEDLMLRPELVQNAVDTAAPAPGSNAPTKPTVVQVEKQDTVSQAVKETEQLDSIFSLCRHGKYDEVELLLNSPDWSIGIDAKDATGNTLLSVACQNNNKRIAKLCMRRGADINTQNLNGQSLLHYCHEYGFHDLMEYLMEKGARDDLLNSDGLTCYEGLSQEAVDAI